MNKTAAQIARNVMYKCGFSVTDRGHAFDAKQAILRQKYETEMAKLMQEEEEDGGTYFGNLLSSLRFGGDMHPTADARRQQYVAKKHQEGSNAWNPLGGAWTPIPEERGGTSGPLGRYGKVE
jgi:hypothetical protein